MMILIEFLRDTNRLRVLMIVICRSSKQQSFQTTIELSVSDVTAGNACNGIGSGATVQDSCDLYILALLSMYRSSAVTIIERNVGHAVNL